MPKSATFENDVLKLIFNGTPIANIADNASTSPLTNLYLALHTADPGSAGNQSTNEIAYTGYARVQASRTLSGWTITGNVVAPTSTISFPSVATGSTGSPVATFVSIGVGASGAGKILYSGALTPNVTCTPGVQPQLTTSSTLTES